MNGSTISLGEVCDLQQGLAINKKSKHLIVGKSNLSLLRITDLIDGKKSQYIDENLIKTQFIADDKSLIYTRTGQVGLVFKNRRGVVHNNCFKVIPKEGIDINYLYYLLKQKQVFNSAIKAASKAAQPDLTHGAFKSIKVKVVEDEKIQKEIALIISAYDQLIDNSEKRIKILEEMAQRLYAEWFVKFKFPGHEKVQMVESPLGKIPEGWEVVRLSVVAKVVRGTSYSSEQINDSQGDYYLVNLKSFNRGGGFRFDGEKYYSGKIKDEQELITGDIVVAVTDMTTDRAVISRPALIPNIKTNKITFSADVVKIIPEKIPYAFTYYSLLDYRFTETTKNKANGANVLHLKPEAISEFKIIIPSKPLLEKFESYCINLAKLENNLNVKIENLSKTRDLLIPQLVAGRRQLKSD